LSSPDFVAAARRRLAGVDDIDEDVIAELAAQLEDAYAAALERGVDEAQARQDVEEEILGPEESWRQLDDYLQRHVRPTARLAARFRAFAVVEDAWRRQGRWAARHGRRDMRFVAAVALTLSLYVGVVAALSTVVHAVLLRPLPFPEPDRVVFMAPQTNVAAAVNIRSDIPSYFDRLQRLTAFQELAMFRWIDVVLDTAKGARRVRGDIATPSLLRLIGVNPLHGRLLEDGDDQPGAERKIVLSHSLWLELFAGNQRAIGADLMVNGQPFTVVGIMPPDFGIFRLDARFWIPAVYSAEERADNHRGWLNQYQIGRLKDGASLEDARRDLAAFDASEAARFPVLRGQRRAGYHTSVERLRDVITRDIRPTMNLLLVGALVTLLLGLTNLSTLTVARARRNLGELATRRALGASWPSLALQQLAQNAVVGAIGGTGALLLAAALLSGLRRLGLEELPRAEGLGVNGFTVLVCVAAAMLASGIMALMPLATLASVPLVETLRDGGTRVTSGARYLRHGLIAIQVAAALVLTIATGLTLVSLGHVRSEHPGFSAERVVTVSFDVPAKQFPDASDAHDIVRSVLANVGRIPGVVAAGVTHLLPFGGRTAALGVRRTSQRRGEEIVVWDYVVSPGYFSALQLPLVAGRYLDELDTAAAAPVIMVSSGLAERLWSGGNPIGQQLLLPPLTASRPFTVVGVVGDVQQEDLTRVAPNRRGGAIYRTHLQADERSYTLAVRAGDGHVDIAALAGAITAADPRLASYDGRPLQARVNASLVPRRLALANAAMFALTALLLVTLGLYAALAYLVAERQREFGIRLALGSSPRALAYRVTSDGLLVAAAGLLVGLVALRWLRPLLDPYLYAVGSEEAAIVVAGVVVIVLVSALASLGPARRASRIDPLLTFKG
jgi:putative ABC transport system permease protein